MGTAWPPGYPPVMPIAVRTEGAWLVAAALAFVELVAPGAASAQPAHCERAHEPTGWPASGAAIGAADPTPVTPAEARRAVGAFRSAWRSVRTASPVLRSFTECMGASYEHFVVRRVAVEDARRGVEGLASSGFASSVLSGSAAALSGSGWVWEVYWGGASRRHPPSGPVSAYFSPDLRTLVTAVQWPEG